MEDVRLIIINESNAKSIISDTYTLGMLLLVFWLNYKFLGNSVVLQIVISGFILLTTFFRGSKKIKRMNKEEALEYLAKND